MSIIRSTSLKQQSTSRQYRSIPVLEPTSVCSGSLMPRGEAPISNFIVYGLSQQELKTRSAEFWSQLILLISVLTSQ